jgi:hypothetical protein
MKIGLVRVALFHADGWTEIRTAMTKLAVTSPKCFAWAPHKISKNRSHDGF